MKNKSIVVIVLSLMSASALAAFSVANTPVARVVVESKRYDRSKLDVVEVLPEKEAFAQCQSETKDAIARLKGQKFDIIHVTECGREGTVGTLRFTSEISFMR